MALSPNDKKVRDAKRVIKQSREREEDLRSSAPSRSTGIRNVYKQSHETLARVEEILSRKS